MKKLMTVIIAVMLATLCCAALADEYPEPEGGKKFSTNWAIFGMTVEINYEEEGYGYKKVLVVDDNTLNIKVVRRILEQFDLVLEECYNGQECIDMVSESNDYDLILMDVMMPGLSGEETLTRLKLIPGFETPVIAVTADAEPGAQEN